MGGAGATGALPLIIGTSSSAFCRPSPAPVAQVAGTRRDRGGPRSSNTEPQPPAPSRLPSRRGLLRHDAYAGAAASASAEIGLGCCTLAESREHWRNRAPPTRCGKSEGQVAAMRVTTFVLPLAAQALVAPRPHMKRLSSQRQAAVRRPRRNPSRCLLALLMAPSTRSCTDGRNDAETRAPRRPSRTTARLYLKPLRPRPR